MLQMLTNTSKMALNGEMPVNTYNRQFDGAHLQNNLESWKQLLLKRI